MCCPLTTFNYQLKAPREVQDPVTPHSPKAARLPALSSKCAHSEAVVSICGSGPFIEHTGKLARWCLLQSWVSAGIKGGAYLPPTAHTALSISTAVQADSSLWTKGAETKSCRLRPTYASKQLERQQPRLKAYSPFVFNSYYFLSPI